jgi:hypothetical protein
MANGNRRKFLRDLGAGTLAAGIAPDVNIHAAS